jgi:hypothetical protein
MKKFGIPTSLALVMIISMVLSLNILAKDNEIRAFGNGLNIQNLISKKDKDIKPKIEEKVEKDEKVEQPEKKENQKFSIRNYDVNPVLDLHRNIMV